MSASLILVLGGGLAALAVILALTHRLAYGLGLLAATLALPVFLKLEGWALKWGDAITPQGGGQTLPMSILAVAAFGAIMLAGILKGGFTIRRSPLIFPIGLFIAWNFLALLAGLTKAPGLANILFFLQTVAPIACFFIALNWIRDPNIVTKLHQILVWTIGGFAVALVGFHLATRGIIGGLTSAPAGHLWLFPLYTLYDYVPLVVAVGYGLGLALLLGGSRAINRPMLSLLVASMLVAVLLLVSRAAVVTVLAITAAQVTLFLWRFRSKRPIWLPAMAAGGLLILLLSGLPNVAVAKFKNALNSRGEEASIHARLVNVQLAVRDIVANPVAGRAYVPAVVTPQGGRIIANPHNQYLTYAVRAGLPSLLLFLWIMLLIHRRLYLLVRSSASPTVTTQAIGLFSALAGVCLVANFFQDNFVQPYSAFLLWFLMGLGEYLYLSQRSIAGQPPVHLPMAPVSQPVPGAGQAG